MKKKFIILIFIILLVICYEFLRNTGFFLKKDIYKSTRLDVDRCKVINIEFPEASFNGDGEIFAKFNCDINKNYFDNLKGWSKFPIIEKISVRTEKIYELLKIDKGYYYYINTQQQKNNIRSDSYEIINSSSSNFILIIYDSNSNVLYYYEYNS